MLRKIIAFGIVLSLTGCHICGEPGNGQKKGQIVKLEKVGVLWKTWEGELIRGGFSDGGGTIGSSFHFTIDDTSLLPLALECLDKQSEVLMSYEKEMITGIWRSEKGTTFLKGLQK